MNTVDNYRHEAAPDANPIAFLSLEMQGIIWEVIDIYGTTWEVIESKKRTSSVADARHLIAAFLAWHSTYSLVEIGEILGGRNHGTIIHSRRRIADLYDSDVRVKAFIDDLEKKHLGISDHESVNRYEAEMKTSSGFVLPGRARIRKNVKTCRRRDSDGRRILTASELREENRRMRNGK